MRPVDYLDELGWLGEDVWLAHCVHLDGAEIARFGATGTGVAHCPNSNARLGAGIAPVGRLIDSGVAVGLGVDGAASNEDGGLASEMRAALQFARLAGGPQALTARQALARATIDGARCLGRDDELGSLEVGKLADVALWRLDGLEGAGIDDPVAALVFGATQAVELLLVGGRAIVEGGELRTVDEAQVADGIARESRRLAARAGARV
jgi:cytosine/adenosine deaminase-related metal-dependent hydrolase